MNTLPVNVLRKYRNKFHLGDGVKKSKLASDKKEESNTLLTGEFVPRTMSETAQPDEQASAPSAPVEDSLQSLVQACAKHYEDMEVSEKDILPWFVYNVRNRGEWIVFVH